MATLAALSLTGTAMALWYYSTTASTSKRKNSNEPASSIIDTHLSLYRAPTSFFEDLYFFVEGLRFFYGETLFKWKTADLLFGLYYLCQANGPMSTAQLGDVGSAGTVFGLEAVAAGDEEQVRINTIFLQRMDRCFRYNSCLRERRPVYRKRRILQKMGIDERDFLEQATSAGVLKPSYVLVRDHELQNIVLMVRGTHSVKDAFTSLTGASKPHHVVDGNGVTLGYSHFGMLAAARWLKGELEGVFEQALRDTPGYGPLIIGHSLGGGAAAMLTMMLREQGGVFQDAHCLAIACPACMTMELAESCKGYVTSVVNGCDAIPMMSSGSADGLREEVMASEWYEEFHRDMRQYKLFRAFESTKRWVRVKRETMGMNVNVCGAQQGSLVTGLLERARGFVTGRWGGTGDDHGGTGGNNAGSNNECSVDHMDVDHMDGDDNNHDSEETSFLIRHRGSGHDTESLEAEASWRRRAVRIVEPGTRPLLTLTLTRATRSLVRSSSRSKRPCWTPKQRSGRSSQSGSRPELQAASRTCRRSFGRETTAGTNTALRHLRRPPRRTGRGSGSCTRPVGIDLGRRAPVLRPLPGRSLSPHPHSRYALRVSLVPQGASCTLSRHTSCPGGRTA